MIFLHNSFPDHEIEVKLAVPDNLQQLELSMMLGELIDNGSLNLERVDEARVRENTYHYFQTFSGRKIAKIVENLNKEYRPKRKWTSKSSDIPQAQGLVIKREETTPRLSSYEEALVQVQNWARDLALEVCVGSRLVILKTKTPVRDLKTGRIVNIIVDEARDLDNPNKNNLRQIEIEYKGETERRLQDDFGSVSASVLEISKRIIELHPELKYTEVSKFKHFRRC